MNLVTFPRPEGEPFTLNSEYIVAMIPHEGRTEIHMTSGYSYEVSLSMDAVIQRLSQRGWRKGE